MLVIQSSPTRLLVPNQKVENSKALWVSHLQAPSHQKSCLNWSTLGPRTYGKRVFRPSGLKTLNSSTQAEFLVLIARPHRITSGSATIRQRPTSHNPVSGQLPSCNLARILVPPIKNVLQRQSRIHSEPGRLYRNVFRHGEARCRAALDQTERCLLRSVPARA